MTIKSNYNSGLTTKARPTGENGTMLPTATFHMWNDIIISQKDVCRAYSGYPAFHTRILMLDSYRSSLPLPLHWQYIVERKCK